MSKVIICLIFIFGFGCSKYKDERLSMPRINYTGNELQTDGYYYRYYAERIVVCVIYRNGIIRACGSSVSLQDFENQIDVYNKGVSTKNEWGVFIVDNNTIKYEMWHGARFLEPYITYIYAGKIINDTTFHITESYRPNGSERCTIDEMWHFKQFSTKPDSTNNFIK
jgi:hypothetical protein